jgi:threonine synthase
MAAMSTAATEPGSSYASHNWHPFFIEGVKTWAFEVWEQLGFKAPDAIVVPVGSGSMLLGAYLAFTALMAGGEIDFTTLLLNRPTVPCSYRARLRRGRHDTFSANDHDR